MVFAVFLGAGFGKRAAPRVGGLTLAGARWAVGLDARTLELVGDMA